MSTRRASQLTIGYSPIWKQQSGWNVPLSASDLTKAFPATSRNYIDIDPTTEDIEDCTGEDLLIELVTGEIARLQIDFDLDPDVFAGLVAGSLGSASAPSAGTNEKQLEVVSATGGTRSLTVQVGANAQTTPELDYDAGASDVKTALEALSNVGSGNIDVTSQSNANEVQTETMTADAGSRTLEFDGQTTAAIAYDANAATIQAALELLSNVETGDIVVAGSGPYTYTFGGQYANQPVPLIVVDDSLLENGGGGAGSGSSAIAQTTPGTTGGLVYEFKGTLASQDVNMIVPNINNLTGGTSEFSVLTGGVGYQHPISRMTGYSMPLFTFYVGFRGSDKQPVIFKNVVVNSWTVRSASREKVTGSAELIGSADLVYATGYTMPECQNIVPLRFGDCKAIIGTTDYIATDKAREFEWTFSNDVNPKFDGAGIYATRHERADKRPTNFNLFVLGEPGDGPYIIGKSRATMLARLQLGPDGRNVNLKAPAALIKLANTPIRFGGDPAESEIALVARPKKVSGDATTPINATATISQSATLLSV